MASILIVDDEVGVLNALRRMCLNQAVLPAIHDPSVTTFTSALHAIDYVLDHRVDLVISDYRMREMDGVSFLTQVKQSQPDAARLMLSDCIDVDGIANAIDDGGIFRVVSKPWSDHDLKAAIADALAHRALLLEKRRLAHEIRSQRDVIARRQL